MLVVFAIGCGETKPSPAPEAPAKAAPAAEAVQESAPATSGQINLSPANSNVEFVGAKVIGDHGGAFQSFSGTVEFKNADPTTAEIDVKIDLASVKTDSPQLDEHLKSPDFFDVAKFPEAKFVSSQVAKKCRWNLCRFWRVDPQGRDKRNLHSSKN